MALAISTSRTLISNKKSTSHYLSTCSVLPIKFTSNFGTVSSWNGLRQVGFSFSTNSIKPEQRSNTIEETPQDSSITQLKKYLYLATEGINRGIFGVKSDKKSKIEDLVKQLEAQNPTPDPTVNIDELGGLWKLIYSTVTILGSKRTKLGLRDFITLGDFFQTIDVSQGKAVNVIKFSARGLSLLNGQLKIEASFKISSNSRVDICYENSTITPIQLMNMFSKNYDVLLGIFNPEGWLEITYVDDNMRIGRDDKGNIFILERSQEN